MDILRSALFLACGLTSLGIAYFFFSRKDGELRKILILLFSTYGVHYVFVGLWPLYASVTLDTVKTIVLLFVLGEVFSIARLARYIYKNSL